VIDILSLLADTDLFADFEESQLKKIATAGQSATWPKGYALIRENEHSDSLYLVCTGSVEISINPNLVSAEKAGGPSVVVAEIFPGQVFGEIALVDQGIRSATARTTEEDTLILRLPRPALMAVCEADPRIGFLLMRNLAADIAQKLRNTDLTLRQYELLLRPN